MKKSNRGRGSRGHSERKTGDSDAMIKEIREDFAEAVERSGKDLATDPFFMALLLAQQRTIKRLRAELEALGVKVNDSELTVATTLDS